MRVNGPKVREQLRSWRLDDKASQSLVKLVDTIPVERQQSLEGLQSYIKESQDWRQFLADNSQKQLGAMNFSSGATVSISATYASMNK